ncbi:MAG: GAF domain-containing protein [Spirochaetales bacterium]|nr:GAF domain-containing protein [Spirochaetales bacterium]
MRYDVIIDRSLGKAVPADGVRTAPVHYTDDIPVTVKQIRDAVKAAERGLLVFVSAEREKPALACLKRLSPSRILSRVIVVAVDRDGRGGRKGKRVRVSNPPESKLVSGFRTSPLSEREVAFIVGDSLAFFRSSFRRLRRERKLALVFKDTDRDQEDLIKIGRALSTEKNIDALFRMILARAMNITGADAGTIYIIEKKKSGEKRIRVKYSHTSSRTIDFEESILPYSRETIAGYVAITGKVLNIPDVARLGAGSPVTYNPRYDREHHYRTKSMLVVPMRNHADEIIGVIQLINSKENQTAAARARREPGDIVLAADSDYDRFVAPFARRYDRLLEAVAGQAAIAIENARMIRRIESQFDEFVKASVSAIESRDEATRGHSERVARLCARMAEAIDRRTTGPFKDVSFPAQRRRELDYAALLHDFGKVYLDARIFLKAKKLYPEDLDALMRKIDIAFRQAEIAILSREVELLSGGAASPERLAAARELAGKREENRRTLAAARERIRALNEPTVARDDPRTVVDEVAAVLASFACPDFDGRPLDLFDERERDALLIPRGSLTPGEKREIESHVEHTYNFVSKIPWPGEWERIPEIARDHHEFLDGSGYPRRLTGRDSIPLEARMMCIADIFDALTASDRPYKKAVPLERALHILKEEMRAGKLDPDLLALFEEERIWEEDTSPPKK